MLVDQVWHMLPYHFSSVVLDAFVIMPDHIHGIIVLKDNTRPHIHSHTDRPKGTIPGSLPAIVQNFKAVSARRINTLRGTPGQQVWQEDYYS